MMPREKELYRENLLLLRERFGDVATITIKDASEYLGCDPRTIKKMNVFASGTKRVSVTKLASVLS